MDPSSLKVDATFLLDESKRSGVYVCNINIPVRFFDDESVRQRVHSFIQKEFIGVFVTFQISGSYYLKHKRTNEEKFWAGSFFPRGNLVPGRIAELFTEYTRYNLEVQLLRLREIADSWRYSGGLDTEWTFHLVNSAIITLNARLPLQHQSLVFRGFNATTRKNVCFELPE
jgi:hypothetical protein